MEKYDKKEIKKYNEDFIDFSEIANNINEFLNLDYDLDLIRRIEKNEPISKFEYLYYEYSLPVKLICLNHLLHKFRGKDNG